MDAARIDYDAFRGEVRAFARAHCPPEIRATVAAGDKLTKTEFLGWQRVLAAHGWRAPGWPKEFGGTGWDIRQRLIFEEVMAENDCPPLYHHGLGHIGPVIIRFGTPAQQKARFCRASSTAPTGGARAIPSPARVPTWPRCRHQRDAASGDELRRSTARRSGPRMRTRPT